MHASVNMGCQGKSGPGKIHEVILVIFISNVSPCQIKFLDGFETEKQRKMTFECHETGR